MLDCVEALHRLVHSRRFLDPPNGLADRWANYRERYTDGMVCLTCGAFYPDPDKKSGLSDLSKGAVVVQETLL